MREWDLILINKGGALSLAISVQGPDSGGGRLMFSMILACVWTWGLIWTLIRKLWESTAEPREHKKAWGSGGRAVILWRESTLTVETVSSSDGSTIQAHVQIKSQWQHFFFQCMKIIKREPKGARAGGWGGKLISSVMRMENSSGKNCSLWCSNSWPITFWWQEGLCHAWGGSCRKKGAFQMVSAASYRDFICLLCIPCYFCSRPVMQSLPKEGEVRGDLILLFFFLSVAPNKVLAMGYHLEL